MKQLDPGLLLFGKHFWTAVHGEYDSEEATVRATLEGMTAEEQALVKLAIGDLIASDLSNADIKGLWKKMTGRRLFRARDARPFLKMIHETIGTVPPFVPAFKLTR